MMSKKVTKSITAIVMAIAVMFAVFTVTTLTTQPTVFAGEGITVTDFQGNTTGTAATKVTDISKNIIGIVQVVGTAVAVVMLVVLGIKYVIASASEKAEIKKSAPIYVVAAVFIFAAVNILAIVQDFANDVTDIS